TAGADDLSPAWVEQLVEEGRLVLPLGLASPTQQCVALVRHGRDLTSAELCPCGFMLLRGAMAPASEPVEGRLAAWLATPGRPTGHEIPVADLRAGFSAWLALTHDGYLATTRTGETRPGFGL